MATKNRKKKSESKKMTTSKAALFATMVFSFVSMIAVLVGWLAWDRADAAGLAGVFAGLAGITIGFYSWKAKNENLSKYKSYRKNMEDNE